ncbi:MAG TPA: ATP12 family protein [Hyphomicrobiaceae bacterium]|jgi:chaperone required for assembly of F1-ATPase
MTARPKRFYRSVSVGGAAPAFRVMLDRRPARTPARKEVAVPSRRLAEALAAEWAAQGEQIDPATMPLTRLVNTALDGVTGREDMVRAEIVKYAGSDLLCYRASAPHEQELARRQAAAWDPVLAWARAELGVDLSVGQGIVPVAQPQAARAAVEGILADLDTFALAAHHVMTALTGSALLALAHGRGRLTAAEAWAAAHIDEDWQIGQWGEDAEARARRERRWTEMQAASRLLALRGED